MLAGSALPLPGLILYTGDNSANRTAPDNGAPFEQVGSVCNSDPQSNARGTAVHVRGKYFLTANHVSTDGRLVTFDDSTFYEIDTAFTPVQIGTTDMKLCKLRTDPGLEELTLNTNTSEAGGVRVGPFASGGPTATVMVGYGRGRSTSQEDPGSPVSWTWGGYSTVAKRWGTNSVAATSTYSGSGYSYQYLLIYANSDAGDDEAALAEFDSGSALFQEFDGEWVLSGIATLVSNVSGEGTSTFDTGSSGDYNIYVRISSYASDIEAALPDLSTFDGWVYDNALSGASADPAADPDADGMNNLEEYAYGTDPRTWDVQLGPQVSLLDGDVVLSWQESSNASGLTYTVEETDDLVNTPFAASALTPEQVGTGTGVTTWQVTLTPTTGQTFLRLVVSLAEAL